MKTSLQLSWRSHALGLALAASLVPAVGSAEDWCRQPNGYTQHNLVSDVPGQADNTDPNLVNPWGLAFNPFGGPVWVSDNGKGVSTLYDGNGTPQPPAMPLVVSIPTPPGNTGTSKPTGIVFNGSDGFVVSKGTTSAASRFIFATEDGTIAAWSPTVDFTHAILVVDNSRSGAIYKGLAFAGTGSGLFLYATDFHNGKIDVFDSRFAPVALAPGEFQDSFIPQGFAPFGIQNIHGSLYVTYAKQDEAREDDVAGKGLGFVDVFDSNGHLVNRLIARGKLNAPWGLALAPSSFGKFSNRLLVGNFGDGFIHAYDLATGRFKGRLERPDGSPVQIDGLWGLSFGNGVLNQPPDTLFFTAGPDGEAHGLYGKLDGVRSVCHGHAPEPKDSAPEDSAPESE